MLRSRRRWISSSRSRERYENEARATLDTLGLKAADLMRLAHNDRVIVRIPYPDEASHWEARILPWEYLLAAATREERIRIEGTGLPSPFTVMRELHLLQPGNMPDTKRIFERGLKVLFVECLPSELRERWRLDTEQEGLQQALPQKETTWRVLSYPTLEGLTEAVRDFQPHLIHFAGLDSHLGVRELRTHLGAVARVDLGQRAETSKIKPDLETLPNTRLADAVIAAGMGDGVLLQGDPIRPTGGSNADKDAPETGFPRIVLAYELATALKKSGHMAFLVTFNMWNTAARVAPLVVGEGASLAAVGFQDAFDDALAEFIYATLYSELVELQGNVPEAFHRMWGTVRKLPETIDATGVSLWAGAPLLAPKGTARPKMPRKSASLRVSCKVKPISELNYAVLHNAQPMFEAFVLECTQPGKNVRVDIDVSVHMGAEAARYRRQVLMEHRRVALTNEIHVPLTASLARAEREAIGSSLSIEVRHEGDVLYCDTHRLRLLPVDQWRDNDRDGRWLPSFVQPRDPAVAAAVTQAQRYVRVLRDDPTAGFEGYQLAMRDDEESLRGVDQQAEAIWAALLHDWKLGYINPPPSYSEKLDSQRLRMPCVVREHHAGTCIDLALLFAACLELVDIYPVIFLLNGHALPGFWRHPAYRDEYIEMPAENFSEIVYATAEENPAANAQTVAWHTGRPSWGEIRRWIRERKLVPIETVRLTENCGFAEAVEAGVEALSNRRDFHSMLEILTARIERVTPLPIAKDTQ